MATVPQAYDNLGFQMPSGEKLNRIVSQGVLSYNAALTALAGGAQVGAPVLDGGVNNIATVASANDSVVMPKSSPGKVVYLRNGSTNACQVFANTASSLPSGVQDTINGTAGATGVSIAAGKTAQFICYAYGAWLGPVALA